MKRSGYKPKWMKYQRDEPSEGEQTLVAAVTMWAWVVRRASLLLVKKLHWRGEISQTFISQSLAGGADWKMGRQLVFTARQFTFIIFFAQQALTGVEEVSNWVESRERSYHFTCRDHKLLQGQISPSRANQMGNLVPD